MFSRIQWHRSHVLVFAASAGIVGIGIGTLWAVSRMWLAAGLIISCAGISWCASRRLVVLWLSVLCISIGALRAALLPSYTNAFLSEEVSFSGVVTKEPEIFLDTQRIVLTPMHSGRNRVQNEEREIHGRVQIKTALQPRYAYGDVLRVECVLRSPEPFDGFAYDRFLAREGIAALCSYPLIEHLGARTSWTRALLQFKAQWMQRISRSMPAPENSIILGSVFGIGSAIPPPLLEQFRVTGTAHVLVISGSNVVLLASIVVAVLRALGCSPHRTAAFVLCVLFGYAVLTGGQPPAVRATVFGCLCVTAELFGRRSAALRLLLFAGVSMLLVNPLLLWYDAGFQLSFLATAGIILLNPWWENRFRKLPQQFGIRTAAATTASALITTTPLTVFQFHSLSLIAPFANVLVVPAMSAVMIGGVVASAYAWLPVGIARTASLPLTYGVELVLDGIQFLSTIPYASISIPSFPVWMLILVYAALFGFIVFYIETKAHE